MKTLALFFTFNVSIDTWAKSGLLDREKIIYEEYIRKKDLKKIYWFTYGPDDKRNNKKLARGVEVIPLPKRFNTKIGKLIYSFLIPFIHQKIFHEVDIIKTNQMPGSWAAVLTRIFYRKPLLLRTGWTWSLNLEKDLKSKINLYYWVILLLERIAYKICDAAEVSSSFQKKHIAEKYNIDKKKIHVIPNFIDINIFNKKNAIKKRKKELLFVGRLEKEKNLKNLLKAVVKLKIKLNIYGNGSLKKKLEKLSGQLNAKVIFKGSLPNDQLPRIYNKYKYFILPSHYECMPKVLLEAMACGCICIGTPVTGINEIIKHKYNGWLADDTDERSIYKAVDHVVNLSAALKEKISHNANKVIKENYSLESVVNKEKRIINKII